VTPRLLDASGRVLLLTGAGGGIGRAVAALYRAAGGRVTGLDLEAPEDGLACDVTDEAAVEAAVAETLFRHGRIDAVVHAAGVVGAGPLADTTLADWRRVTDANLTSAFLVARAAAGALRHSRGGLVLVGSSNGRNGGSRLSGPAYAAAKAGLHNLTRYLAKEWAPEVRVNALAPGPVRTAMLDRLGDEGRAALADSMPTGGLVEPEEIAAAAAFLLSDHARSMTGTVINVSGGLVLD
jgi:NAD(P)-dependent dehydrogenase (short-subunit alcohol dehydrogenase family)